MDRERGPLGDLDPFSTVQPEAKAALDAARPARITPTTEERLLAALERAYGPLPPRRAPTGYDIRMTCRFCRGQGCLNCDTLAQREFARQFPPGQPIAPLITFAWNNPEDMELLQRMLGAEFLRTLPPGREAAGDALRRRCAQARAEQQRVADAPREEI